MTTITSISADAADRLTSTLEETMTSCLSSIEHGYSLISQCLKNGGTVFACGNGGSSATAAHFIAELVGRYKAERGPLRAVALGSNLSTITAISNDYGYDQIFERELRGLARPGDVLVAFSTSGKSPNVLNALDACNAGNVRSVVLTGQAGASHAGTTCTIAIPTSETARVQELHDFIIHVWCEALDTQLTKGD